MRDITAALDLRPIRVINRDSVALDQHTYALCKHVRIDVSPRPSLSLDIHLSWFQT